MGVPTEQSTGNLEKLPHANRALLEDPCKVYSKPASGLHRFKTPGESKPKTQNNSRIANWLRVLGLRGFSSNFIIHMISPLAIVRDK